MKIRLLSAVVPSDEKHLVEILLENRGIADAAKFLNPLSPNSIALKQVGLSEVQVRKAVERIHSAKTNGEKIIVFGDYDCDGVCATAVLWETLFELGCKAMPYIPDREKHGYGLSEKALDEILSGEAPAILISVDNGITAVKQWKRLKDAGVFTILTDHHEIGKEKPKVDALIHTTELCGTTVAWMLARELDPDKAETLLDLCGLATIADQVPLVGANRSFAYHGLKQLNETKRLGLKLIIKEGGLIPGQIDSRAVNFGIVPRINAMGRIGHALDALRALCTKDAKRAQDLTDKLSATNTERQKLTRDLVELVRLKAEAWADERVIIVSSHEFHEGVIGLIAGRLTEEYHKPAFVIAEREGTSKASARSVPGVHVTKLLWEVSEVLLDVGGHPLAAGFRLETSRIQEFTEKLKAKSLETIAPEHLVAVAAVDCQLPLNLLTLRTAKALMQLEPYGQGNPQPQFLLKDAHLERLKVVGADGRHVAFRIETEAGSVSGIAFGMSGQLDEFNQEKVDLVATLGINRWKDRENPQLQVKSVHPNL